MTGRFYIAFCANGTILPGLHVSLFSMVRHLGKREQVALYIFYRDINETDLECLSQTVKLAGGVSELKFVPVDHTAFLGLPPLTGDWMPYMRLDLPQLVPQAPFILYLDSDVVVTTDVCRIFEQDLGSSPLGATCIASMKWSLEHAYFRELGMTDSDNNFNSGVLLFNATVWREQKLTAAALEFAQSHVANLRSHDQTILNALFYKSFYHLPESFNVRVCPEDDPIPDLPSIFHFIGSPKPWDLAGRLFNRNWRLWSDIIAQTPFRQRDFYRRYGMILLRRMWIIRRSYARVVVNRCKSSWFKR